MNTKTTFKRVAIGTTFQSNQNGTKGQEFRKIRGQFAVKINPETHRGDTANPIKFSRSHAVLT